MRENILSVAEFFAILYIQKICPMFSVVGIVISIPGGGPLTMIGWGTQSNLVINRHLVT